MHSSNINKLVDKISIWGIRVLVSASLLLGFGLMLFSGYAIYEQYYTQSRAFTSAGINTAEVYTVEAQQNLVQARKDYRAWIKIDNTNIDYPVMQSNDDLYYANHDIDGNVSLTGAIYMAADNTSDLSDDYIVIYGHHMDNGAMFGDLEKFLDKDFFDSNDGGKFVFPDGGVSDLKLWAVVHTDAYEDEVYSVDTQGFDDVVEYVNKYSKYIKPSALDNAKKIIALSTCYDATTNGRIVVFYTLKEEQKAVVPTTPSNPATPANDEDTGIKAWAIINLLCLIIIVYILVPIFFLRKKYGRIHKMRKVNKTKEDLFEAQDMSPEDWEERERIMTVASKKSENGYVSKDKFSEAVEELFFKVKVFTRKFIVGIVLEVIFVIAGVIIFILTEDMTLPMVLIDRWTPVMLLLMIGSMLADYILARYKRPKKEKNDENEIRLDD